MDEKITEHIDHYLLHDPIGNVEGSISEYDNEKLVEAERQGAVFIAVYTSGRREIVKAEDITAPQPSVNGITVVQPQYVDQRTQATVAVFDALQAMFVSKTSADEGAIGESFQQALSVLRDLAFNETSKEQ